MSPNQVSDELSANYLLQWHPTGMPRPSRVPFTIPRVAASYYDFKYITEKTFFTCRRTSKPNCYGLATRCRK